MQHVPVMLRECLEYLNLQPAGVYLDATCGLGGHSGAIARLLTTGKVLACDRDPESLDLARANTADCADRIRFHQALFSQLEQVPAAEGATQVDGLLADLGVSKYQLTEGERGFSLMSDGPLDMRMTRSSQSSQTAADIVNYESEHELADLIFRLGEERRSRKIARAIVRARPIQTTGHLAKVIEGAVPRTGKLHPATQTFMALRIAVNNEPQELEALLHSIPRLVRPGGRAVILTFMSLEDRTVKQSFQAMAKDGRAVILTRHVVRPAEEEIWSNPPSRSAKLRAVELL
ncbi:MAG TPA: 16S rRNA (cytosine(1402)-N(4))-methyltransferase RsmH [Bryobacteraceae bacterium]